MLVRNQLLKPHNCNIHGSPFTDESVVATGSATAASSIVIGVHTTGIVGQVTTTITASEACCASDDKTTSGARTSNRCP